MGSYNMHWDGYTEHFRSMMKQMLVSKENSDITFVCDELQTVKAHKNILGASSPAFQRMFGLYQGKEMFLYMRGIKHHIMESILEFIYLGEVKFSEDCVEDFVEIARSLEITGLHETIKSNHEAEERQVDEIAKYVSCKTEQEESNENDNTSIYAGATLSEDGNNKTDLEKTAAAKQIPMAKTRGKREPISQLSHSPTNSAHTCKSCGKMFAESSSLSRHKKSIHDGVKYPCKYCEYQATIKQNLDRHVAVKHTSKV